jgi:hypothetical protein
MFSEEREDQSMNIYHRRVGGRRLRPFSRKPHSCVTGPVEFLESKQTWSQISSKEPDSVDSIRS